MERIDKRLTRQLITKGMSPRQARKVAVQTLIKSGSLDVQGNLTRKGIERTQMGAKGRAISREAERSGRSVSDYVYSSKTNRATLRNKP
jgi:hypothetical protein